MRFESLGDRTSQGYEDKLNGGDGGSCLIEKKEEKESGNLGVKMER